MKDKFVKYYSTEEKIKEMSEYVHINFRLILTKMLSEMRRKLDIKPDQQNSEGYVSLMMSLQGRLFNEMVYSMCGSCQSHNMKITEVVPPITLLMLLELMKGINPLQGHLRRDVVDLDVFNKYYLEHVDELREVLEALPK